MARPISRFTAGRTKPCASIPPITIRFWRDELGVQECGPGWFGENFSVQGQSETDVAIGDTYRIGTAVVQISQPRAPCWKLGRRWNRVDMPKLVLQSGRTGWYLRVLEEGGVERGDTLALVERPFPRWTIDAVNAVAYSRGGTHRRRSGARAGGLSGACRIVARRIQKPCRIDIAPTSSCCSRAPLLERAGLARDRARTVADVLVEGDLLGHDTHGLDQLAGYLVQIEAGLLATSGDPEVVSDLGACLTWDGHRLPGHWLVKQAIAEARHRILAHPIVTVVIGRGHHIGCLQAYLKPVTDAGLIIVLMCSDPSAAGVAPHGGVESRITPNPIAAGFPTAGDPILIDISSSTSTNAMNKRLASKGERLKGPWLVDADGRATDDPRVLSAERPGAMLPLGGIELGHKGFSLALIVEALTSGLAGRGRSEKPRAVDGIGLRAADRSGRVRRARRVRA